jgi:hypothetical protein
MVVGVRAELYGSGALVHQPHPSTHTLASSHLSGCGLPVLHIPSPTMFSTAQQDGHHSTESGMSNIPAH